MEPLMRGAPDGSANTKHNGSLQRTITDVSCLSPTASTHPASFLDNFMSGDSVVSQSGIPAHFTTDEHNDADEAEPKLPMRVTPRGGGLHWWGGNAKRTAPASVAASNTSAGPGTAGTLDSNRAHTWQWDSSVPPSPCRWFVPQSDKVLPTFSHRASVVVGYSCMQLNRD